MFRLLSGLQVQLLRAVAVRGELVLLQAQHQPWHPWFCSLE
jgi:hypothetical protein